MLVGELQNEFFSIPWEASLSQEIAVIIVVVVVVVVLVVVVYLHHQDMKYL
jgi:sensor histidine kinase regulating citrate/malate metabolism